MMSDSLVVLFKMLQDSKGTRWYKNCKAQRKRGAKICQDCPFCAAIDAWEDMQKWDKPR